MVRLLSPELSNHASRAANLNPLSTVAATADYLCRTVERLRHQRVVPKVQQAPLSVNSWGVRLRDYLAQSTDGYEVLPQAPFVGHFADDDQAVDWAVRLWNGFLLAVPNFVVATLIVLVGGQTILQQVLGGASTLGVVIEFVGGLVFLVMLLHGVRR